MYHSSKERMCFNFYRTSLWWVWAATGWIFAVDRFRKNQWQFAYTLAHTLCIWCRQHPTFFSMQYSPACVHAYRINRQCLWCVIEWSLWHTRCTETMPRIVCNFSSRPNFCWAPHSPRHGTRTSTLIVMDRWPICPKEIPMKLKLIFHEKLHSNETRNKNR